LLLSSACFLFDLRDKNKHKFLESITFEFEENKIITTKKNYALMQSKGFFFEGQNIYIGMDVHLKTWAVAIMTETGVIERFSQESEAKILHTHLQKKYPENLPIPIPIGRDVLLSGWKKK
jgi:hypothetical protein